MKINIVKWLYVSIAMALVTARSFLCITWAQEAISPDMKQRVDTAFQMLEQRRGNQISRYARFHDAIVQFRPRLSDVSKLPVLDYLDQLTTQKIQQLTTSSQVSIPWVVRSIVTSIWLQRINSERISVWLTQLVYDSRLEKTAQERSEHCKSINSATHERNPWDGYYNYNSISKRFADRWLVFKNVYSMTFSENLGWWVYSCSTTDCTQKLITATKSTRDFFMAEKTKSIKPHYNTIVGKYFTRVWIGIALDPSTKKYFFTAHYGTDIQ